MRESWIVIPPEWDGWTVNQVLRRGKGLSITQVKRAKFSPDGLLLEGERVFTDRKVAPGQRLRVRIPEQSDSALQPTPGPVDIRYEDEWLLVVYKPPGLSVHPGPGHHQDTLGNFLTWHYARRGETLVLRPVNRLDRGTSGLMLLAKSAEAHYRLQRLLHTPSFARTYLALCQGIPDPPEGQIDAPIGRVPGQLNQWQVTPEGKAAQTDYRLLRRGENCALAEVRLHTGRTHQIRVHFSWKGWPLAGDTLYGGPDWLDHPARHAWKGDLRHPFTGEMMHWQAPPPEDFTKLLEERCP